MIEAIKPLLFMTSIVLSIMSILLYLDNRNKMKQADAIAKLWSNNNE